MEFLSPVRYGDRVVIEVVVEHIGHSSVRIRYEVDDRVGRARDALSAGNVEPDVVLESRLDGGVLAARGD